MKFLGHHPQSPPLIYPPLPLPVKATLSLSSHDTLALFLLLSAQAFLICIPLRLHSSLFSRSLLHFLSFRPSPSPYLSLSLPPLSPSSATLSLSSSSLSLFLARSPVSTTSAFFSSYTFKPSTQQPRCPSCEVSRTRVSFVRVARIRWGRGRVRGRDKETTLNLGPGSKTATECGGRGRG